MELNISRPRRFTVVIVAIGLHLNGSTTYYHAAVTPVLVAPGRPQLISLEPEFITTQDGQDKQDCENAAAKRWIAAHPRDPKDPPVT